MTGLTAQQLRLKITAQEGVPMLQNNPQMIDLNNHYAIERAKFKKADQNTEAYNRVSWEGALYYDDEIGPYIPASHIEASIANASSKLKNTYKKLFKASVFIVEPKIAIEFKGSRTLDGMWKEKRYDLRNVKIVGKGVIKCRPKFENWHAFCTLTFIPTKDITANTVLSATQLAGQFHGIGDYLPKFGRFIAENA